AIFLGQIEALSEGFEQGQLTVDERRYLAVRIDREIGRLLDLARRRLDVLDREAKLPRDPEGAPRARTGFAIDFDRHECRALSGTLSTRKLRIGAAHSGARSKTMPAPPGSSA